MDSLNWIAIVIMTVISFIFGHLWFGVLFGKQWQRIHGMDCMDEKAKKAMMKGLWKIMMTELISTFLIIVGLACVIRAVPEYSGIKTALMVWIAFIVPLTASNVVWGGDKRENMMIKITITVGYRLIPMLIAGYVFTHF
jgi:Protein of unknown function (DUF1761)